MVVIVLAENKVAEPARIVQNGKGIELVIPDDVVGLFESGSLGSPDDLLKGGHELTHLQIGRHTADTIVTAGDDAHQTAFAGAVLSDSHGGMTGALFESQNIPQCGVGADVGVAADKTGLVILGPFDHGSLVLHGLGAINKGYAALGSQRDSHPVAGDGLHDCGDHGNVHGDSALFASAEFHKRRFQADVTGNAFAGGVAWDKKILIESVRRFVDDDCHFIPPDLIFSYFTTAGGGRSMRTIPNLRLFMRFAVVTSFSWIWSRSRCTDRFPGSGR